MKIPKGYTEEQVLKDIEYVTERLSRHFKFGYYSKEDIKQEGCVEALKALKAYNPKKNTTLRTFLYTHIRNRFINMKRNKCISQNIPCVGCGFRDKNKKESQSGCREFNNKEECLAYKKWAQANQKKHNLINSYGITSDIDIDLEYKNFDIIDELSKKEILQTIEHNIPFIYREDYCRFLQGARIPLNRKNQLIKVIQDLLRERGFLDDDSNES